MNLFFNLDLLTIDVMIRRTNFSECSTHDLPLFTWSIWNFSVHQREFNFYWMFIEIECDLYGHRLCLFCLPCRSQVAKIVLCTKNHTPHLQSRSRDSEINKITSTKLSESLEAWKPISSTPNFCTITIKSARNKSTWMWCILCDISGSR